MGAELRILLIDDHRSLTDALILLLKSKGYSNISTAHSFDDGLEKINSLNPDVSVVDMNLGKEDSCELIRESSKSGCTPVVLSAYSDVFLIKKAIKAGAKGYLSKSSASENLIKAVKTISEGREYYDPLIQDIINKSFSSRKPEPSQTNEKYNLSMLTEREKQIIKLIAAEYSSDEIALELYLSKNTIDSYRKTLIQKLGVRNSVGLSVWAVENGV